MKQKSNLGFTLVELLVTIAIIGILAAIVLVNLNSSRISARDARRVADVRQIVTALDLFYNDNNGYPLPDTASLTGPGATEGDPDWVTYLAVWPVAPVPADNPSGSSDCTSTGPGTGTNQYTYTQTSSGGDYTLDFCIGSQVGQYAPGLHTATSAGIN